jgi:PD-(D/E)XK endonuclease
LGCEVVGAGESILVQVISVGIGRKVPRAKNALRDDRTAMRFRVAKRKAKPGHKIGDKKKRGEWVELKFMAEAAERDLPAAKPFGDSENFDVVVGRPGRFVGVQVKCTVFRSKNGEGYICSTCSSHNLYREGAFDFLAAYVVPEDVWFILPAKEIAGMRSVSLCTPDSKWEKYREGWELLREAVGVDASEADPSTSLRAHGRGARPHTPNRIEARMLGAFEFVRRQWER